MQLATKQRWATLAVAHAAASLASAHLGRSELLRAAARGRAQARGALARHGEGAAQVGLALLKRGRQKVGIGQLG
jgi:cellobiose-specific phosphotransferase system component IIA